MVSAVKSNESADVRFFEIFVTPRRFSILTNAMKEGANPTRNRYVSLISLSYARTIIGHCVSHVDFIISRTDVQRISILCVDFDNVFNHEVLPFQIFILHTCSSIL